MKPLLIQSMSRPSKTEEEDLHMSNLKRITSIFWRVVRPARLLQKKNMLNFTKNRVRYSVQRKLNTNSKAKYIITMKKNWTIIFCLGCINLSAQQKNIYHKGWIDFNKNGAMDVFEDPSQSIDKRVENLLSQMTLEEKSCQMATLYGYGRVLKDEMPTANWKNEIWKDGIANIDEELSSNKLKTQYSFPYSKHAEAINTIQKWFVEETRLGIPVDFTNEGIHGLTHDRATPLPAPLQSGQPGIKT